MNRVSDIDLRHLRVFVAVVEAECFAAAESVLNVATSTISLHIGNLESRVGIRLCERGRRGFSLTERGRVVYEEAKRLLKTIDDFSSTKSLLAGRLAIGVVDTLTTHADFPLPNAIREFNKVKNEVEFDVIVGSGPSLERDVISGKIHAAIGPFMQSGGSLDVHPLFYEPHDLYCGVGHPLFGASKAQIRNTDFSDFTTVHRPYQRGFDVTRFGGPAHGRQREQHGGDAEHGAVGGLYRLSAAPFRQPMGREWQALCNRPGDDDLYVGTFSDHEENRTRVGRSRLVREGVETGRHAQPAGGRRLKPVPPPRVTARARGAVAARVCS